MSDQFEDLRVLIAKLKLLMDDPHPGLITWCEAYVQTKIDLLEELQSE